MSRQFSIPTVLRMVPNSLLKEFFGRFGDEEHGIDWAQLRERDIDSMMTLISSLTNREQNGIETELRNVFELACATGHDAIIEGADLCDDRTLVKSLPSDGAAYEQAMWVCLNRPAVFEKALLIHQVDHLGWWRKRNDLPAGLPSVSETTIRQLAEQISQILVTAQGRGKMCTVESMTRGETIYFFAYPDDFAQSVITHDEDGKLSPHTFRHTFEIVFAFDWSLGTLELFAKVSAKFKRMLEQAFGHSVLGIDLGEFEPDAVFELDHLRNADFVLETDPQDRVEARITEIRLVPFDRSRRITVQVDVDCADSDFNLALKRTLNSEETPLSQCHIASAVICFDFLPLDGRKSGRLRVTVSYPRTCGMRCDRAERIDLVHKYLKYWNIDVGGPTKPAFAEAGR